MDREEYNNLLEKAVVLPSNNYRLENFLSTSKQEASVVFLGGSITLGFSGDLQDLIPFPDLVMKQLPTLPQCSREYSYHNYGFACFHSVLGITLLEKYVLPLVPDLVIMEYSVNNSFEENFVASFEAMIRRLLLNNPEVSIILVCSLTDYGYTCEPYMQEIANNYSLPLISLKNALSYGEEHGFSWNDFFYDFIHPSTNGHKLIADSILHLFSLSQHQSLTSQKFDKALQEPVCSLSKEYIKARFLGANELPQLEAGCFCKPISYGPLNQGLAFGGNENTPFRFQIRCRKMFIIYELNYEFKSMGQIKVTIEPEHQEHYIDGCSIYGWGNLVIYKLIDDEEKDYNISIQMKPFDKSKNFSIYGFLLT